MRKQTGRKLMAGILVAVMMITSVPETVYAIEQAGRTEQENSAWAEDGNNVDEKIDGEDESNTDILNEKNDVEDESKVEASDDENDKDDVNGDEMPIHDNVSGEENVSETDGENNGEKTDVEAGVDSPDNTEIDDSAGEEDLAAEDESGSIKEEEEINYITTYAMTTQNDAVNWIKDQIGKKIGNGECVDLTKAYFEYMGFSSDDFRGNATAYANMNPPSGWQKILRAKPIQAGDVVIWSGGHVALAISDSMLVEQNYLNVKNCEEHPMVKPGYDRYALSDYWGVWRPNFAQPVPPQPIDRVKGSYMDTGYDQAIPDGYYHIVSSFGDQWWMTIAGFSVENGANVSLYDYSIRDFECDEQLFYFKFIDEGGGKGFYKITNKLSGKCLDVADASEYMYKENGIDPTNVQQYEDNGSPAQQWAVRAVDGGEKGILYTLQARCSGFCLDLWQAKLENNANISMCTDNGTPAQQWRLVPYAPVVGQTIEDGEYQIVCHEAENKAVGAAENTCGANVELGAAYKGNYRQTFDVKYIGSGYYSIINKYSGLSLDVAGHSRMLGTNVWLWDYIDYDIDYDAQKWIIKPCGNGYYSIISKCNGLYLNLENGDTKDENNICMWHWNSGRTNQMWKFVSYVPKLDPPTASIPSGTEVEAGMSVSLLSGTDGAAIYYTLDGTNPSKESFHYTKPFVIEKDTVITAYVVKDGYEDSDPAVFTYTVKSQDDYGKGDVLDEDIPQGKVENIPQGLWMSAVSSQIYTGKAIKPQVRVYDYTTLLTEKKDYIISYKNNVKANIVSGGNVPTITVTGKGNYTGKEVQTFVISPKSLADVDIMADDITLQYNGKVQKPLPFVTWNGKKLTKNKDYTVSYPNEESDGVANPTAYIKSGTYTVLIKGMGNYTGEKTINLTITQSKSASTMTVAKIADHTYTGTEVRPVPVVKSGKVVLTEGEDYEVSYQNNIKVGTATVMITGKGSYAGVKKVTFKIVPRASLNKARAELEFDSPLVYNGRVVRPDRCWLTVSEKNADGRTVTVTLTEGADYEVSYRNDNKAGTATVIFQGVNGYSGTLKKTYKIAPYDIGKDEADLTEEAQKIRIELADSYAYVKGGCKPEPVVTYQGKVLTKGTDYTLSYRNYNGLNDGSNPRTQPVVIVKGKGCFKGTREKTYRITSKEIGRLTMTAADRVWQNKGNIYKTKVVIKDENGMALSAGRDYDSAFTYEYNSDTVLSDGTLRYACERITAQDIIPAGTVIRVTAAAKGSNYTGTVSCVYRITKADIGKAVVTIPTQTYTGRAITPENEIRIKLNGQILPAENYKITGYGNNINKGTATVTISGINDCGGTKTAKFKIKGKGLLWWWR
ncbi:MAG: hypothetical protein HDR04_11330 [Lachnospiraceae bacterium]|nr:hypothetical protein [Lachnospiraceae bacterium]